MKDLLDIRDAVVALSEFILFAVVASIFSEAAVKMVRSVASREYWYVTGVSICMAGGASAGGGEREEVVDGLNASGRVAGALV